jgi:hypothetical protein
MRILGTPATQQAQLSTVMQLDTTIMAVTTTVTATPTLTLTHTHTHILIEKIRTVTNIS